MSDVVDWGWVKRTLTNVQAEQRMLRGIVEPLPARMSAMEARFGALEARIGGIEESINGVGLLLKYQGELLEKMAGEGVMTTMIAEVYDALIEAGASEPKARKAAEAVAAYETRFAGLELRMERMDGRLTLIQWMLALLIGGVASLVVKAFV